MSKTRNIVLALFIIVASLTLNITPSFATTGGSLSAASVNVKWYTTYPAFVMRALDVSVATGPTFGISTTGQTSTITLSVPTATTASHNFNVWALCKTPAGSYSTMSGSGQQFNNMSSTANNPLTVSVTYGACSNAASGGVFDRLWIGQGSTVIPAADGTGSAVDAPTDRYGVWWFPIGHSYYTPPPAPDIAAGNCSMTDSQMVQVARAGGFAEADIRKALAIAIAESSLKVNALNQNGNGSYDIGLWQINDTAHPSYDRQQLGVNPTYNANAAHEIFVAATNSFSPWVAYTSGSYLKFMDRAATAITNAPAGSLSLTDCSGGTSGITDPDEIDGATDDGSEQCSGWNPLTYFKCALRWAFVPPAGTFDQWSESIDGIADGPPLNWIISGFNFCNAFIDGISGADPDEGDVSVSDFRTPDGQNVNFLSGARDAAQSPGSNYGIFFAAQVIAIWGGIGWMMLNMVNRRFGGKE